MQQRQLLIPMEYFVILALLPCIITIHLLIAMFPGSARKISVKSEFSTPQLLFYLRASFEYLPCSQALYDSYNLCHAKEACSEASKAFPIDDPCGGHAGKLIETAISRGSVIASIPPDATVEFAFWQEVHQM